MPGKMSPTVLHITINEQREADAPSIHFLEKKSYRFL
jgi:hypothetical protein